MTRGRNYLKWTPAERKALLNRWRDEQGHIHCACCKDRIAEDRGHAVSIEHDPPWEERKHILRSMPRFQAMSSAEKGQEMKAAYRYGYCEPTHIACHREKDGRPHPTNPLLREMMNCGEEPTNIRKLHPTTSQKSPYLRDAMHNIDTIQTWLERFATFPASLTIPERAAWGEGRDVLKQEQQEYMAQLEHTFSKPYAQIRSAWEKTHAAKLEASKKDPSHER